MAASIEDIHAKLFTIVSGATWTWNNVTTTWKTTGRRVKLFSDVDKDQQPAMFQAEHGAIYEQKSNLPYKRIFDPELVIYIPTHEGEDSPTTQVNIILQAIQDVLGPVPGDPGWPQRNTMGGMVYHTFIDGRLLKDPGDVDNQGMLIVPLKILAP